jgi:hypothetical protein
MNQIKDGPSSSKLKDQGFDILANRTVTQDAKNQKSPVSIIGDERMARTLKSCLPQVRITSPK